MSYVLKSTKLKKLFFSMSVLILFLLLPAFIIPFAPEKVSDFYYREITYSKVAKDLIGNSKDATLINMFEYVANNLHTYKNSKVVDRNSFIDLVRGVGWCDQQAFLLMHLLNKSGVSKTRLRDVQGHTYSEVRVANKWVVVDPYSSLIFLDHDAQYLGIEDLKNSNIDDFMGIIKASSKSSKPLSFSNNYQNIFIENEVRWKNGIGPEFIEYRSYNLFRRLFEVYGAYAFSVFGDKYYYWLQDQYLESDRIKKISDQGSKWIRNYSDTNDNAFRLFYKARNYILANRVESAVNSYKLIIKEFPNSYWAKESKYNLAILYYKDENYLPSKVLLLDLLLNYKRKNNHTVIDTDRDDINDLVAYYLGLISLEEGYIKKAKEYFLMSDYKYSPIELYKIDIFDGKMK